MKTNLYWNEELRFRLSQAISSSEVTKIKPESFSSPPVANWFFRISTVPQLEYRGIDSSNTLIRHVTAIVPFICLEFRTFRSQTNQNPDLASFLKWSHNQSNDGTHRWIQRWKDIMAACFKSGAKDATGTKVANQILSSIPRGLSNTGSPEKIDKRSILYWIAKKYPRGLHFSKALFEGLIYIGKFAFQDRLGWPYIWKEIYPFLICFTLYLKASSKYKPPGSLYLAGQFNRGFFALRVWGAYIWRGLFTEFYGISNKYILTIIMYLFIYFSWLIYDWNLNRTKDSLEVQMLQQHNLFYYGVLTLSLLTSRQPREEFQCLYENLMSDGFRKTAVLKKILFSLLEWDFKENDNRRQTFISKFIFQFSVELGFLGFHVNVKNFNRNY